MGDGGGQTEGTPYAKVLRQARRAAGVSERRLGAERQFREWDSAAAGNGMNGGMMGNRSSLISPHPLRNQPRGDDHSPKCQIPQPEGTELGSGPRLSDPTPHSLPASTSPDRADGLTLLPGAPAHQAASRRKSSEIQLLPFMKTSAVCVPHALCLPNPSRQACRAEGRHTETPLEKVLT